jgi:nitrogenase subunit NifH
MYCLKDGLTVGETVLKRGDIFKLPLVIEGAVSDMSDEQLNRYQKRIYSELMFRKPTPEELVLAYHKNHRILDLCDSKEKLAINRRLASALEKRKQAHEEIFKGLPDEELSEMLDVPTTEDTPKVVGEVTKD